MFTAQKLFIFLGSPFVTLISAFLDYISLRLLVGTDLKLSIITPSLFVSCFRYIDVELFTVLWRGASDKESQRTTRRAVFALLFVIFDTLQPPTRAPRFALIVRAREFVSSLHIHILLDRGKHLFKPTLSPYSRELLGLPHIVQSTHNHGNTISFISCSSWLE